MTTIHADELHAGDVVVYLGQLHQVTRVDRCGGWAWPVAYDDAGWAIALGHDVVVLRPPPDDPTETVGFGDATPEPHDRSAWGRTEQPVGVAGPSLAERGQ